MVAVGIAALSLFGVLLVVGSMPRLRNEHELAAAVQKVQTTPPNVYVIRPEAAAEAELSLAATTQAIRDAVIYARTSGYISKRHVDIGDRVAAGQLPAEIRSAGSAQHLPHARAAL